MYEGLPIKKEAGFVIIAIKEFKFECQLHLDVYLRIGVKISFDLYV